MIDKGKIFVPVMITPFSEKAKVDWDALAVLIDFYLACGVKGLFANCLSSEMYSITGDERLELTAFVVKHVNGRVPVVATGSFGFTIEDKASFTKQIFDKGIDAVVQVSGHFAKMDESDEILFRNFEKMLSLTGNIPLGTYECPVPYKRILSAELFRRLVETNRFIYHKDTAILPEWVKGKLEAIAGLEKMEFYDAHTPNTLFSLSHGARGMSSISGNFYPEIMVWMTQHAGDPERQEDLAWMQEELTRADPLIQVAYPMSAKYFLQKRGLPVRTISRATAFQLMPDQRKALDDLYDRFLHWCERLSITPVQVPAIPFH